MEEQKDVLNSSLVFIIHKNGDVTVETPSRSVRLKRSLSSHSFENNNEPETKIQKEDKSDPQNGDNMEDIYKKCRDLSNKWYDEEYNIRIHTSYDSKRIDGELYLGRCSSEQLEKEREEYYQKLLNEYSHRVPN